MRTSWRAEEGEDRGCALGVGLRVIAAEEGTEGSFPGACGGQGSVSKIKGTAIS